MTILSTLSTITYLGNSSTTVWTFPFNIPDSASVLVQLTTGGITTTLAAGTYTAAGFGTDAGGTVTYPLSGSPIPPATKLTITRNLAVTQPLNLTNQQNVYLSVIEQALDRGVMLEQRSQYLATQALRLRDSDTPGAGAYQGGGNRIENLGAGINDTDAATIAAARGLANTAIMAAGFANLTVTDRFSPQKFGVVGTADDRATLFGADALATTSGYALYIDLQHNVGSNLTFTAPVIFGPNSRLIPAAGVTISFARGATASGTTQIFNCTAAGSKVNVSGAFAFVTPDMFGALGNTVLDSRNIYISGADDSAAFLAMFQAGIRVQLIPGHVYGVQNVNVAEALCRDIIVDGNGGASVLAYIGPATEADVQSGTTILRFSLAQRVTVRGVSFKAPISQVLSIIPGGHTLLRFDRSSSLPRQYYQNQVKVLECSFEGGINQLTMQSPKDSYIARNILNFAYQWGMVTSENQRNLIIEDNIGSRIGVNEFIRIGSFYGAVAIDVTIRNNLGKHCGLLGEMLAGGQNSYDIYCADANGVVFENNKGVGSGASMLEMKWGQDLSAGSRSLYKQLRIAGNYSEDWWGATSVTVRNLDTPSAKTSPLGDFDIVNNVVRHVKPCYAIGGASASLTTTAGSSLATLTLPGYAGTSGDTVMIRYWTDITGCGGVPHHILTDPLQVISVAGSVVTVQLSAVAVTTETKTLTANAGAARNLNCFVWCFAPNGRVLGNNPITLANGSNIATITDVGINAIVGNNFITLRLPPGTYGGIAHTIWNRRFEVRGAPTVDTMQIQLPVLATDATLATGGGGAAVVAFTETPQFFSPDYLVGQIDRCSLRGNVSYDCNTMFQIDATGNTTFDASTDDLTIVGNVCYGGYLAVSILRCTLNRAKIKGNDFRCMRYGIITTQGALYAPSLIDMSITDNDITLVDTMGNGNCMGIYATGFTRANIFGNRIWGAAWAIRVDDPTGWGVPSNTGAIYGNQFDCASSPDNGSTNLSGRDAVQISQGVWTVEENRCFVDAAYRGVNVLAGTVSAARNQTGYGIVVPTKAGGVGDTVENSAKASGAPPLWVCTTAGNAGGAVWKAWANLV